MVMSTAVVFDQPRQLSLRELALASPGAGDVVVDIHWSSISAGTERLLWEGRMPAFPGLGYPLVPGYESVGVVTQAGADAALPIGTPVFVPGANFYAGDPHMVQGNGEVALTALEHSMRATFRLTLLKKGDPRIPSTSGTLTKPFGETPDYWITIGLHPDLNEAMKEAVRESVRFLSEVLGMDRAVAYAYLSAATDFNVSQVVDRTKGIHGLIRKADFRKLKHSMKSAAPKR